MIVEQFVEVKRTKRNAEHYDRLGYSGELMLVNAHHLTNGSQVEVEVTCDYCGKGFRKKYKDTLRGYDFCCKGCADLHKSSVGLANFEKKIGQPAFDFLNDLYINKKMSTREISKFIYGDETHASCINGWISRLGIPLRQGGEAVKTQWINADDRRQKTSEYAKINLTNEEVRNKIRETSKTEEFHIKMSRSKSGANNPMYGRTAENSPRWNPNRTHEKRVRERKLSIDKEWRMEVMKRDNFTCQCCGYDRGGTLVAHHLDSYDTHVQVRHDVSNGITLCENCHKLFHSEYGYGNNTKEQFKDFLNLQRERFT